MKFNDVKITIPILKKSLHFLISKNSVLLFTKAGVLSLHGSVVKKATLLFSIILLSAFAMKKIKKEETLVNETNAITVDYEKISFVTMKQNFIYQKNNIHTAYLINNHVSRVDQLSTDQLKQMNKEISELYKTTILKNIYIEEHVKKFLVDTVEINKIETALMEQIKYQIPASIKLSQAALETGYGSRVVNNNYFGIKDKKSKNSAITTTEYYNEKELVLNHDKIISKEKVFKDGKMLYKCKVIDNFEGYNSAWESFRAHSVFLNNNPRYYPLFKNGKNYEAWADRIGSTKYGGVGYATAPDYGDMLKKIIKKYHLYLLDN